MTGEERAAYAAALEPWARRAEREGKVIDHVSYRYGRAEVMMVPRKVALSRAACDLLL